LRYPRPLEKGDLIGVTSPSGGVREQFIARLELVEDNLSKQGYRIQEGKCLRGELKHVSAEKRLRAVDFMNQWENKDVGAIIPPWGGELLIELLPILDFKKLRTSEPKWLLGYSDTSTLLFVLTVAADIATAHGTNLMDNVRSFVSV
jgi:muramoyltetrapeptide carboxypeptidase